MKSKYCLSSAASFDKINKSVTNRSPNKQTFSFARGDRFENSRAVCPINTYGGNFYNKNASKTGIGYGNRSDFTRCLTVSPSSSKYNLKSFWDQNTSKKKGAVMGLSRNRVSFNSYINKELEVVPSPSKYNNEKPKRTNSPKYSLRPRTTVTDKTNTIEPQNNNPGPGNYLNPEMDSSSHFKHVSKFQNLSYGQAKGTRFNSSQTIAPGPGKYKDINNMPKTGQYVLSQNRGGTKARFDKDRRESMFDKVFKKQIEAPGPGYYQMPSEFGQYDGDIYNDLRKSKRSKNGWNIQSDRLSRM